MELSLVISSVALAINIFTAVFVFGYWKGKVDIKIDTLWEVYVTSALAREQQRRMGHSRAPIQFPSEWYEKTKGLGNISKSELCFRAVRLLGAEEISRVATANSRSFEEAVGGFVSNLMEKETCRDRQ